MKLISTLLVVLMVLTHVSLRAQTVELRQDCGTAGANGIGLPNSYFSLIVCFDQDDLDTLYDNYSINQLKAYMLEDTSVVDSASISLLQDYVLDTVGGSLQFTSFGTTVYSADILSSIVANQWTVHTMSTEVPVVSGHNYAVRINLHHYTNSGILALDTCSMVYAKGAWIISPPVYPNGIQLSEFAINHNVCLRAGAHKTSWSLSSNATVSSVCLGDTAVLDAGASGGPQPYLYEWAPAQYLDCATCANPHVIGAPDSTIFYLTITDSAGEIAYDSVLVFHIPQPDVTVTPDTIIHSGQAVGLSASSSQSVTYSWIPAAGIGCPSCQFITVSPVTTTTYTVTITNTDGCQNEAQVTVHVITGIDDLANQGEAVIYPNPSEGMITLSFSNNFSATQVEVFNPIGALCFSKQLEPGDHSVQLNLGELPKGIYTIALVGEQGRVYRKVVIE